MGHSAGGEADVGEKCCAEHRERKGEDHDVLLAAGSLTAFHSKERAKSAGADRAGAQTPSTRQYGRLSGVERSSDDRCCELPPRNSAPRASSVRALARQPPVLPLVPLESRSTLRSSAVVEKRGAVLESRPVLSSPAYLQHRLTRGS